MVWCGMEIIGNQTRMVWEYKFTCYCVSGNRKGETATIVFLGTERRVSNKRHRLENVNQAKISTIEFSESNEAIE